MLLCCVAAAPVRPVDGAKVDALRVLFVGNSLTYTHDVPELVESLARGRGGRRIETHQVAFPDYGLEDHWTRGDAPKAIRKGNWDFVVLQQGPSAAPANRVNLIENTRRFDAEIRKAGGRTALYGVWPMAARSFDAEAASESYRLAAAEVDGVYIPVGAAWRFALEEADPPALYSADGLHQSVDGALLAALVIASTLLDAPPSAFAPALERLYSKLQKTAPAPERLRQLLAAADRALKGA